MDLNFNKSSLSTKLGTEFPHLDSSLLSALLLDFPDPSAEDESLLREMLSALSVNIESEIIALEHGGDVEKGIVEEDLGSAFSSNEIMSSEEVDRLFEAWTIEDAKWMDSSGESVTTEESASEESDLNLESITPEMDDSINFLSSVFPKLRHSTLLSRLKETGDLETVVELLLNEEFISATQNVFPEAHPFNFADFEMEAGLKEMNSSVGGGAARKKARKREKSALKASQVLSLTDVLHRSPVPSPAIASLTAILPNIIHAPSDTNRWINMDSTSSYLAILLHIPAGRITSAYHRMDSSLPLAIDSLLTALELERPFIEIPDHERLLTELSIVLPSHSLSGLMRLLSATEGDPSDALDLKVKLEEIAREEGSPLMNGLFGFGGGGDRRRVVVVQENSTLKPIMEAPTIIPTGFQGWKKVPSPSSSGSTSSSRYASSSSTNTSFPSSTFTPSDWTAAECDLQADDFLTKRNEYYRAAAKAIQSGGANRLSAGFLAEQGRECDRKRRIWEQRRAFAVVGERRIHDVNTVDLHGLTLHHALSVTKSACNAWWSGSSVAQAPLRIITGVGRHSVNQNPVLMPAVVKLLGREGWKWQWDGLGKSSNGRGALLITGTASKIA